jgi:hypothetical protein
VADRLTAGSILGKNAPHAVKGNSGSSNRPHSPTCTYTSSSRISRALFCSFQRAPPIVVQHPVVQRKTTQVEDIFEYKREYAALGPKVHQVMTLVEYCELRLRNCPRDPQRGG